MDPAILVILSSHNSLTPVKDKTIPPCNVLEFWNLFQLDKSLTRAGIFVGHWAGSGSCAWCRSWRSSGRCGGSTCSCGGGRAEPRDANRRAWSCDGGRGGNCWWREWKRRRRRLGVGHQRVYWRRGRSFGPIVPPPKPNSKEKDNYNDTPIKFVTEIWKNKTKRACSFTSLMV